MSSDAKRAGRGVQISPGVGVAWVPDQDLEHPQWVRWGRRLGAMSRVSNWWVGDWLQYGTSRWGEKYSEAARITGYDVKTLRNIACVAKRFDLSRRRDKLTWSHHAEVTVLEPDEQDRWLDRAIVDQLSVADLRTELRSLQRASRVAADTSSEPDPEGQARSVTCPHCGGAITLDVASGSLGSVRPETPTGTPLQHPVSETRYRSKQPRKPTRSSVVVAA
jgi:hypothetical protein